MAAAMTTDTTSAERKTMQRFRERGRRFKAVLKASPDCERIATVQSDRIEILNSQGDSIFKLMVEEAEIVALSPDGNTLAFTTRKDRDTAHVRKKDEGDPKPMKLTGHKGPITCLATGGDLVVSGSEDNTIRVWNRDRGECIRTIQGDCRITALAINSNGTRLAFTENFTAVKVYSFEGNYSIALKGRQCGRSLAISGDGTRVAATTETCNGMRIRVWDASTGNEMEATLELSKWTSSFHPIAASEDGKRIVAIGDSGINVYNVDKKRKIKTIRGPEQEAYIRTVDVSADGHRVAFTTSTGEAVVATVPDDNLCFYLEAFSKELRSNEDDSVENMRTWLEYTGGDVLLYDIRPIDILVQALINIDYDETDEDRERKGTNICRKISQLTNYIENMLKHANEHKAAHLRSIFCEQGGDPIKHMRTCINCHIGGEQAVDILFPDYNSCTASPPNWYTVHDKAETLWDLLENGDVTTNPNMNVLRKLVKKARIESTHNGTLLLQQLIREHAKLAEKVLEQGWEEVRLAVQKNLEEKDGTTPMQAAIDCNQTQCATLLAKMMTQKCETERKRRKVGD